ncbi:polysaccharide biosynthesis/export family protein [Flavobacterium branchiophilum]|uniref:Sugar transporter n=1 Tax=Flavobacterium branchiophilum TaxID=55197 RepID=A0A2H3KLQ3_9FLAO|nr:polysaccharide biosynthesis/export family protein [Flavobacterium branchiophilum]PDS26651.1 sugar transporter [Flavobacterium branchiophilum]
MNRILYFCILCISFLLFSCVSTKKLIYLQPNNPTENSSIVAPVNSKPYRIQANDILSINIKTVDPKLSALFTATSAENIVKSEQLVYYDGYTVSDVGTIRMPILGEIKVIGMTTSEIRILIEEKLLKDYLNKESNLFVNVKLSGFRYTINGEVGATGSKILYQEKVNIMEAIANAGDISVTGDRKNVLVIRQNPQGATMQSIDLTDVNAMNSPVYNLLPNDYIYVKPLKQKTWGTGKTGIESLSTIITLLSLATTTYLLLKK